MAAIGQQLGRFLRYYDFPLKAVSVIIALIAFVILLRSLQMDEPLRWLHHQVDALGIGAPVVFVLLFIGMTAVFLPGWPLNVAAGALFGPLLGGALASAGSTSAAVVSFFIGRWLGRVWTETKAHRHPWLRAIYYALKREESWKIVAAVRLSHSLPFGVQNFLLGASPIRFAPYLLTTWVVTLPGIFMVAYLGHLAGAALSSEPALVTVGPWGPWQWLLRGSGLAIAACAIFYLGRFVFKAIRADIPLELTDARPTVAPSATEEEAPFTTHGPWWTIMALLTALLFLGIALWCYIEQDRLHGCF